MAPTHSENHLDAEARRFHRGSLRADAFNGWLESGPYSGAALDPGTALATGFSKPLDQQTDEGDADPSQTAGNRGLEIPNQAAIAAKRIHHYESFPPRDLLARVEPAEPTPMAHAPSEI